MIEEGDGREEVQLEINCTNFSSGGSEKKTIHVRPALVVIGFTVPGGSGAPQIDFRTCKSVPYGPIRAHSAAFGTLNMTTRRMQSGPE